MFTEYFIRKTKQKVDCEASQDSMSARERLQAEKWKIAEIIVC